MKARKDSRAQKQPSRKLQILHKTHNAGGSPKSLFNSKTSIKRASVKRIHGCELNIRLDDMDSSLGGGNHNKKTCVASSSEVENDILSNHLPDYLIDSILERLPIKDAVRTSILSRNWRYKWTTMSSMILDEHFSRSLPKNDTSNIYRDVFITITNQIFKFLKGPILKVHLHIPNVSLDDSFFKVQLEQWILSLSSTHHRGVTELVIYNSRKRDVQLPSCLFHCSELRKLQLSRLMFKPPPPPKLECQQGYFLNLQYLSFKNISFESCETVMKLPQLTKMLMIICTHVYNFKIMAPKLKFVKVVLCRDAAKFLRVLLNSRSLTTVHFLMLTPPPEIKKLNLVPRLCNLPYLASLTIDGYFFKSCIVENIPKWLSRATKRLKTLDFLNLNFGDLYQLQSALYS
ncbi:F-box/FBD/LRR-repeat protein At1g13570-like [Rutidosis leptorrhynchoides]|uniref:F-box/FBD/LRR-repeat protein At1g13570-like n=1 Tax=Rutidosis leptorrhynchoides TaxID=125765 RepID=UPI003A99CF8B